MPIRWARLLQICQGTQKAGRQSAFLTDVYTTRILMGRADALQRSREIYFSNLAITSESFTSSALAMRTQVRMVGVLVWLSTKLIAGRESPVSSANEACDSPRSLRSRVSSSTIDSTSASEGSSLIEIDNQRLANAIIGN